MLEIVIAFFLGCLAGSLALAFVLAAIGTDE